MSRNPSLKLFPHFMKKISWIKSQRLVKVIIDLKVKVILTKLINHTIINKIQTIHIRYKLDSCQLNHFFSEK